MTKYVQISLLALINFTVGMTIGCVVTSIPIGLLTVLWLGVAVGSEISAIQIAGGVEK